MPPGDISHLRPVLPLTGDLKFWGSDLNTISLHLEDFSSIRVTMRIHQVCILASLLNSFMTVWQVS